MLGNELSTREKEVAALVCQTGMTNKQAADKLFVSEKTIKFHLTNIYKKLGVQNRAMMIVRYLSETKQETTKDATIEQTMAIVTGKLNRFFAYK